MSVILSNYNNLEIKLCHIQILIQSFTTLNVDIRNHQNLLDLLFQYVKGDLLEGANANHCEKCNKKVLNFFTFKHVYLFFKLMNFRVSQSPNLFVN